MSAWYRWFAWHPVDTEDDGLGIWLAYVWRKDVKCGGSASGESTEYRYKKITDLDECD